MSRIELGALDVDELLFRALAERVGNYLDAVDRLATQQPSAATGETRRLVAAWRALLRQHVPSGPRARCGGCGRKHRKNMCGVWRVAVAFFIRRVAGDGRSDRLRG